MPKRKKLPVRCTTKKGTRARNRGPQPCHNFILYGPKSSPTFRQVAVVGSEDRSVFFYYIGETSVVGVVDAEGFRQLHCASWYRGMEKRLVKESKKVDIFSGGRHSRKRVQLKRRVVLAGSKSNKRVSLKRRVSLK